MEKCIYTYLILSLSSRSISLFFRKILKIHFLCLDTQRFSTYFNTYVLTDLIILFAPKIMHVLILSVGLSQYLGCFSTCFVSHKGDNLKDFILAKTAIMYSYHLCAIIWLIKVYPNCTLAAHLEITLLCGLNVKKKILF